MQYAKTIAMLPIVVLGCGGGCQSDLMMGSPRVVSHASRVEYTGPQVKIAVGRIANRAGVYSQTAGTGTTIQTGAAAAPPDKVVTVRDPIGDGMRDQLITALLETGAFQVTRGSEDATMEGLANSGAEFLLEGAVTEYEPSEASMAGGFGWGDQPLLRRSDPTVSPGNVFSQILAPNAIGGMFEQDHVAINIHLVEVATNQIVNSVTIEAKPKDLGTAMNFLFGGGRKMMDAGGQYKTPMQKAIRACMFKAAGWAASAATAWRPTAPDDKLAMRR